METGHLNVQANTPASSVSERDADGYITVKTPRGDVRTRAVVHATVSPFLQSGWRRADEAEPLGEPPAR